jgi:ATPase subunit of ABC transporter with duplicated ATPase domains
MKAMKQELEWVRSNPKARQAKSKARLARFEEMSSVEYQKRNETQEIFIPVGERLGDKVIEFNGVSKASATAADRQPQLQRPARRHRRHHRPERRRQIDAVQDDHRPASSRIPAKSIIGPR